AVLFFFSSRRRHTRLQGDWSSDVCSSDLASLDRPGGNTTGFLAIEYSIVGKWLELLKQIAPGVTHVAVLRAATLPGAGQFGAIQSVAPAFGVEVRPIDPAQRDDIERAVTAFARGPNAGLIVTAGGQAGIARET